MRRAGDRDRGAVVVGDVACRRQVARRRVQSDLRAARGDPGQRQAHRLGAFDDRIVRHRHRDRRRRAAGGDRHCAAQGRVVAAARRRAAHGVADDCVGRAHRRLRDREDGIGRAGLRTVRRAGDRDRGAVVVGDRGRTRNTKRIKDSTGNIARREGEGFVGLDKGVVGDGDAQQQ